MREYRNLPLWNSGLTIEQRLDYLMGELTQEEKLRCLGTGCPAIERLGIPSFYLGGEGAHGVQARHDQSFDQGMPQATTVFPNPIGMSSTWDTELLREAGRAVGNEARAVFEKEGRGGLCLWAPTVDMERDPRWGRTEEAYGEDPFLTGKMAAAYVRGLRGEDSFYIRCAATLKHFYANNVENGRVWKSSSIDSRNRYEYYLEPFRRVVTEGGAEALMTAYNEVDGTPCLLMDELQKTAKDAWGVHHIVCDGGDMMQTVKDHRYFASHTETVAAALRAGLDCFTDDLDIVMEGAREALACGMITMDDIDRALRCHFGTMIRLGLFDTLPKNPYASVGSGVLNCKEHQKLARCVTAESVVLLQNRETEAGKLLPLKKDRSLAVIGPWADLWLMDWYSGVPPYYVTPLKGILEKLAGDSTRDFSSNVTAESGIPQIQLCAGGHFLGILEDGETVGLVEKEQAETFEVMLWDGRQITLRAMSNGKLLSVEDGQDDQKNYRRGIVAATKKEAFGWFVKEAFQATWKGDSFYQTLMQGEEFSIHSWNGSEFFTDEQGRLRVCEDGCFVEDGKPVPLMTEDDSGDGKPVSLTTGNDRGERVVYTQTGQRYERLTGFRAVMKRDSMRRAAEVAAKSDIALVLAGAHPMITCKEEADRKDIEFPPFQRELIQAVSAANPQVVLALISSVPYAVRWEKENIPAILTMATGSMELGNGLADVLFGDVSPAGRLNMTWYRDSEQLPDMDCYDIIQEERTYQYFRGEVLYPFGHGLTYSAFDYSDLQVELWDRASLRIGLDIRNVGEYVSDEVVQIYVAKGDGCVKHPVRQLKGFQRVRRVAPRQIRHLEFVIPLVELQYFDVVEEQMLLEPGRYEIQAGRSSLDICLQKSILLDGTPRGVRDAMRKNAAEYYDRSRHACRAEGHMGYIGITASPEAMVLEYESVAFAKPAGTLVLDARVKAGAQIAALFDDRQIGCYTADKQDRPKTEEQSAERQRGDGFAEIVIPLTDEGKACCRPDAEGMGLKNSGVLKFVCTGDVMLCRWWFTEV